MAIKNSSTSTGPSYGSAPLDSSGVKQSTTSAQTAVIYDVLSEGPIEGLLDGVASIRLNDNPVANGSNARLISPQQSYDVTYVASTGVVTDNTDINIFNGAETLDGVREILISGGSKRTTSSINCVAGNNIITSTNLSNMSFIVPDVSGATPDVWDGNGIQPLIRIDGAGREGGQLVAGITEVINTSAIRVDTIPQTTVSNTAAYLDYVAEVSSFSGNTATIAAGGTNTSNTVAIMSSPERDAFAKPLYNYENFGFAFRPGTLDQDYLPTPAGIGSASIAHSVSGGNLSTTSGTGYPQPGSSGFDFSTPRDNYTGSALIITSSSMGIGNASEIDTLKATIQFNQMFSQKENGKLGEGGAEYRITFGYSRDGGSTFQDVVKVGRASVSTSLADYGRNGLSKSYSSGLIRRKTKQPFSRVFTMDISKYQPFDAYRLKFERISAVNQKENKWQQQNAGVIKQVENIVTDKLSYPYSAYAAVVVDAEDFGQIPKRTYLIRGLKIKVPTNYFPADELNRTTGSRRTTASYTRNVTSGADAGSVQDWDGNFRGDQKEFTSTNDANHDLVYCNNPIWVFYDLLTNQRYGLGKYLNEDFDFSQIDKFTLYQLAKYCDELVPDGKGGTEPRFTCNLYISKDMSAMKMLKNLASMVRSMLVWHNGKVTLGSNIQKGPVYAFNKSNVIDGTFQYSGTAGRFRHNQIAVTWSDPENGYKQAVEVVEDHDEIARTGKLRRKNISAYGCTSKGQAIRHGKYQLYTEKLEQEIVSFSSGLNASMLRPGDVISVQDSDNTNIAASGRVTTSSASSTTIVKTDRDLTDYLNTDDAFKLNLIFPSGGAYLAQSIAIINSVTYSQGDVILTDEGGASIDTHAKASNLKDDAGNLVQTVWSDDVRIETQTISSFNASSVTVSSAFSAAPSGEVVFTIVGEAEDGGPVSGTPKQYIITSVSPNDKMEFSINAAEYHVEKYDAVDRGWVIPTYAEIAQTPKRTDTIPAPLGLTTQIVPGNAGGGDTIGEGDTTNDYSIVINWSHPTTQRTDSEGETLTDVYEHLAGYKIQHNFDGPNTERDGNREFTTVTLNSNDKTDLTVNQVVPGNYRVRIQTIAINGQTSGWEQELCVFPEAAFTIFGAGTLGTGLTGAIQKGGVLTTVPNINSSNGTVTFASNTYVFTTSNGVTPIIVNNGNANFTEQAFTGVADGESAYLFFDYDNSAPSGGPLRAVKVVEDTTAVDADTTEPYNYQFLARCGVSSNDISAATGTISTTAGLPQVTGSSTVFENDFSEGDVIVLDDAGTSRFMARVASISSNTAILLDSSPSRSYSGANVYKLGLPIDRMKDSIIGEVQRSGSTYSYIPYTNKQGITAVDEIGANTITSVGLSGNSITAVQIKANSIGAAAIVAGAIGSSEVTANAIGSVQIAAGSIDNSMIQANSIEAAQIKANSIGTSEISANSIGSIAITANAIGSSEIAANSIGTVAISANSIGSSEIAANSIGTVAISANSITSAQLTSDAVGTFTVTANSITAVELAANAVGSAQILANSIASAEISANSIGSAEISANAVNGTIIAGNSVGGTQITAGSVTGIIIADNAIVNSKLAQNAVDTAQLLTGAVESLQIANNAIVNAKIALNSVNTAEIISDAITGDLIAANAVDTAQIKANSITSAAIVAGAIGTSEIAVNSIGAVNIIADTINSSHISANSIGATAIVAGAIGSSEIATNSIGVAAIIAGSIDNSHMSANSIEAAQIVAGEIDSSHIGANQITAAAILAGTITNNEIQANTINSVVIDSSGIEENNIAANAIVNAKIKTGAVTNASIASNSNIDFAKINASNSITNAMISAATSIDFAKISVGNGDIQNAMINAVGTDKLSGTINTAQIAAGSITDAKINASGITFAKISGVNITTAQINANAITNAKISSTDNMTITLTDGSAGGWAVTASELKSTNASGGGNAAYTTAGLRLGASGFISAKNFYIDTAGNAKFKGALEGATGSFSGSITVGAFNSVAGSSTLASSVSSAQSSATAAGVAANSAASAASAAHGQANTATTNASTAASAASAAHGQANTATTNAASADTKAGNAYGQANTATTNAANAQSTADSKVTHAAVNSSSTIVGGGIGGWGITTYHLGGGAQANPSTRDFTIGTSTSGNATFLANGGIVMGSDGFISANQFYVDTAGNAKFKGTLEGDDVTVNGTLVLPSAGANVAGAVIGAWQTNTMDNRFVTEVGSGPGFYQGFVRVTGGTHYVKTVSIQIRTGTSTASEGTLIYETPQIHEYTAGNISESRLFTNTSPVASGNMPIAFTYTGSGTVSVFVRAQADTGPDTLGIGEARFIKFGTTDPVYSFANQSGVALSTAFYSNTQVVGGFAGTKTVNISNTSFTRFKIDSGSFGTANSQIANGSYINVEITSSSVNLSARSSVVTIGESSEVFEITTGGTTGGGPPPGGGGGGCFVQGTPIVMADGSLKNIEDVTTGENVKSFRHSSLALDEDAWLTWTTPEIGSGSFGTSNVVGVTDPHSHTNYYWINYNLKVTNEHPMLTFKDGVFKFVMVQDLSVGDYLVCEDGTREEIFAIPKITTACITHNMDVEDDDTYIVRGGNNIGYIAHNVGDSQSKF